MKSKIIIIMFSLSFIFSIWHCAEDRIETVPEPMIEKLALLPSQSVGIGYMNIAGMNQSQFFSMMEERWENGPMHSEEYQNFMEATGLDIRRDIEEIYVGLVSGKLKAKPQALVLIAGVYDVEKLEQYLEETDTSHEMDQKQYKNHMLYKIDNNELTFCFADHQWLFAGAESLVKSSLDNFAADERVDIDPELLTRINRIKYKKGMWFTLDAREMLQEISEKMAKHPEGRRLSSIKSIQNFQVSMRLDDKIWFSATGNFLDEEKAELFHDALKGGIATLKLSVSEDRAAVDVLNKIETSADGSQVHLEFNMSKEDIEKIKESKPRIAGL